MKKFLAALAVVGLPLLGVASIAAAQGPAQFDASLSGANEVGEPGDPEGVGSATITVDVANTEVCYEYTASGIDAVVAGHIHSGGAGSNGDVVVNLNLDGSTTQGCVASDTATVGSIVNTPELFYVNLHTDEFPAGAIRGQLTARSAAPAESSAATEDAAPAPTSDATTAAADDDSELAFTGSDLTGFLAIAGAALLATGTTFLVASRRHD